MATFGAAERNNPRPHRNAECSTDWHADGPAAKIDLLIGGATSEMPTLFYIFTICFAGLFLFVTVNRFERNRPLAILLMILLLGVPLRPFSHT